MRLLLDTNVLVAAYVAAGTCAELVEHVVPHHEVVLSSHILVEFSEALRRKAGATVREATAAADLLRTRAVLVEPAAVPVDACRDPDDLAVLGAAIAGRCRCLVTGDKDLLMLRRFEGIDILTPQEFWRYEARHE